MFLVKVFSNIRSRIRYLRYTYSQRRTGDFTQAMSDALFLNPSRHPVMMGPEELSRFFVYTSNNKRR